MCIYIPSDDNTEMAKSDVDDCFEFCNYSPSPYTIMVGLTVRHNTSSTCVARYC